ncbi:MAG TPA: TIGR03620 family F420-dependent LLM class oxidoreductase [Solirubrobacteraceae bacterium]|jgi:probable F420-dependent oxidoreductase|nr:TIGR03620 family F420-dependent LLM class oxidoreductase [Solirubrobacteraceae bacterium]
MELTRFGVWVGGSLDHADYGEAAGLAEQLGFGALWLGGSPRLPKLRPLLAGSDRMVIATGIVNIWQYDPAELADEFAVLEADFPGRLLLGIGIGHPEATSEYKTPLTKTLEFLDGIAASANPVPRDRMTLAALGPKMLDVSFARTLGTHPYFTPAAHTKFARERLGTAALVAPEQAVVVDDDPERALETARTYAARYLNLSNYTNNLRRFGYTDEALVDGGTKELVDELVPQGEGGQVSASVRAHLAAGADHVCVQAVGAEGVPTREWTELAAALIG